MSDGTIWTQPISGFRTVGTFMGDTIQGIALREMGDAGRWTVLVSLNGLVPPYITDDFSGAGDGVLWAGSQDIRIPAPAPTASGVVDAAELFGTDIALPKGRLAITAAGAIATITGTANLTQAIRDRFASHVRDLIRHPRYGLELYKLLGKGARVANLRLAAVYVSRALNSDPRIASVASCKAALTGDVLVVTAVAVPVSGTPIPLTINIPTSAGGGLLTVTAGG